MSGTDIDSALLAASDILYELSGRRFSGVCSDTVRPEGECGCGSSWGYAGSYSGLGGSWASGGWAGWGWRGHRIPRIALDKYPIDSITQVLIDGAVLDPSLYTVQDWQWLVRMADPDGNNPGWPCWSRQDLPPTAVGTFEVTFVYGTPPPIGGKLACAELACELALLCSPSTAGQCRIARNATQVTRAGTTVTLDPTKFNLASLSGLPKTYTWLMATNPEGAKTNGTGLFDPGARQVHRVTG